MCLRLGMYVGLWSGMSVSDVGCRSGMSVSDGASWFQMGLRWRMSRSPISHVVLRRSTLILPCILSKLFTVQNDLNILILGRIRPRTFFKTPDPHDVKEHPNWLLIEKCSLPWGSTSAMLWVKTIFQFFNPWIRVKTSIPVYPKIKQYMLLYSII